LTPILTIIEIILDGELIRFGLAAIKGVGEVAVETVLAARDSSGPFKPLEDLCESFDRRTVNRKILEPLIRSGTCDSIGPAGAPSLFVNRFLK
jgi:DNA polymerase-3 subunit alpha